MNNIEIARGFIRFTVAVKIPTNLLNFLGRTKSWWLGGVMGALLGVVFLLAFGWWLSIPLLVVCGLLFDYVVSKLFPASNARRRSRRGGGGFYGGGFGGRGGGGGGGFGGFSGGSFGGGGAGGRW